MHHIPCLPRSFDAADLVAVLYAVVRAANPEADRFTAINAIYAAAKAVLSEQDFEFGSKKIRCAAVEITRDMSEG